MTSPLARLAPAAQATPYRLFDLDLKAIETLSPSLTRFVFTGEDVAQMTTLAPDQRVKLLFRRQPARHPTCPSTRNGSRRGANCRRKTCHPCAPTPSAPCAARRWRWMWTLSCTASMAPPRPGPPMPASATACRWSPPTWHMPTTPAAMNGNRHAAPGAFCWSATKPPCRRLPASSNSWPRPRRICQSKRSSKCRWKPTVSTCARARPPACTGCHATCCAVSTAKACSTPCASWPACRRRVARRRSSWKTWISTKASYGNRPAANTATSMPGSPGNRGLSWTSAAT